MSGVSGVWESRGRGKEGRSSEHEGSWRDETPPVEALGPEALGPEAEGWVRFVPSDPTFPPECVSHLGLCTRTKSGHYLEPTCGLSAKTGSFLFS